MDAVLLKLATTSDFVLAPTLTADEIQAGAEMPFAPSLPAATIVAMPADRRLSMMGFLESPSQYELVDELPPRLKFTAAMLNAVRRR